jgi:hypothetical protein
MMDKWRLLSAGLCEQVDWSRSELRGSAAARAWRAGRVEDAALLFVRHLRERKSPFLGYDGAYVHALRRHVAPAARAARRPSVTPRARRG